jgi:hypothetical protein
MVLLAAKMTTLGGVDVFAANDDGDWGWMRLSETELVRLLTQTVEHRDESDCLSRHG